MVYDFRNVSILDLSDCQFVCNKVVFDFYTMSLGKALGPGDQDLDPPHIMGWDDGRGYSCYDDEAQKVVTFREYIAQAPGTDQGTFSQTIAAAHSIMSIPYLVEKKESSSHQVVWLYLKTG